MRYPKTVETTKAAAVPYGLCSTCQHAKRIESDRGSVFILCQLSATDPAFEKYPRLPILSCRGYSDSPPLRPHKTES
jgi:hypothetical protein